MTSNPRRPRRPHLIAKAGDKTTLCNLPTYRRLIVVVSDIVSEHTCDACLLTARAARRGDGKG